MNAGTVALFARVESIRHEQELLIWQRQLAQAVVNLVTDTVSPGADLSEIPPEIVQRIVFSTLEHNPAVRSAIARAHRWAISAHAARHEVQILKETPHHG